MREIDIIAKSIKESPESWTYYRKNDDEIVEFIDYTQSPSFIIRPNLVSIKRTIRIEKIELHNSFASNNYYINFESSEKSMPSKRIVISEQHFPQVIKDFFNNGKAEWYETEEEKQDKLASDILGHL